jgi:hypothetical protein
MQHRHTIPNSKWNEAADHATKKGHRMGSGHWWDAIREYLRIQTSNMRLGFYAAVVNGRFDRESGNFYWDYDSNHGTIVSGKQAARTIQRLKDGHDHITADPVRELTRDEAAHMLANADELLKEINKAHE